MGDVTNLFKTVPNSNNLVLDSRWFNTVGMVLVEDQITMKTAVYIGSGMPSNDKASDEVHIAQWGSKVPKKMAESVFGPLHDYKFL